jgi:hypothetical protein
MSDPNSSASSAAPIITASAAESFLDCPSCYRAFDGIDGPVGLQPRSLYACAHTVCTSCAEKLLIKGGAILSTNSGGAQIEKTTPSTTSSNSRAPTPASMGQTTGGEDGGGENVAASASSASSFTLPTSTATASSSPSASITPADIHVTCPICSATMRASSLADLPHTQPFLDALAYFHSQPDFAAVNSARSHVCVECAEEVDAAGGINSSGAPIQMNPATIYCATDAANYCDKHNALAHALPSQKRSHIIMPLSEKASYLERQVAPSLCQHHPTPLRMEHFCTLCKESCCEDCTMIPSAASASESGGCTASSSSSQSPHFSHIHSIVSRPSYVQTERPKFQSIVESSLRLLTVLGLEGSKLRRVEKEMNESVSEVYLSIDSSIDSLIQALEQRRNQLKSTVQQEISSSALELRERMNSLHLCRSKVSMLIEECIRVLSMSDFHLLSHTNHIIQSHSSSDASIIAFSEKGGFSLPKLEWKVSSNSLTHLQSLIDSFGDLNGSSMAQAQQSLKQKLSLKPNSTSLISSKLRTLLSMSTILTQAHVTHLTRFFSGRSSIELKNTHSLLYRASRHGWFARDFHRCVDSKGSCLMIIKVEREEKINNNNMENNSTNPSPTSSTTQSTQIKQYTFGAYNSIKFHSSNSWISDPIRSSFLFSLDNQYDRPVRLTLKKPNFLTFGEPSSVNLGGRNDIFFGTDLSDMSQTRSLPNSFELDQDLERDSDLGKIEFEYDEKLLAGGETFQAKEIEVFAI